MIQEHKKGTGEVKKYFLWKTAQKNRSSKIACSKMITLEKALWTQALPALTKSTIPGFHKTVTSLYPHRCGCLVTLHLQPQNYLHFPIMLRLRYSPSKTDLELKTGHPPPNISMYILSKRKTATPIDFFSIEQRN